MLRQIPGGHISAFLAHHGRSLLQVGVSSPSASVEEVSTRLSCIFVSARKFSSWTISFSFSTAPYMGNLISWNYEQFRSCSSSKPMDIEQSVVSTSRKENKEFAGVQHWLKRGTCFELTETCKLVLLRGDITKWYIDHQTDAIVNAANTRMLGGGGVDGAIHDKAGPELKEACRQIPEVIRGVRCPTGEARITRGFKLPVSRIIHSVGPIYDGTIRADELLTNAYKNSCALAVQDGVKYIAFPAISCGVYRYPVEQAAGISLRAVKEGSAGLQEVHFILFEQKAYVTWMEVAESSLKKI